MQLYNNDQVPRPGGLGCQAGDAFSSNKAVVFCTVTGAAELGLMRPR